MNKSTLSVVGADILFVDEHLIVLNKYPGIDVIPARGENRMSSLRENVQSALGCRLFVVHRIDRDTSGVVVLCRNADAHRCLSLQFERREVSKTYRAVVMGIMDRGETIDLPIRQFGSGRMGVDPQGKPSTTVVSVIGHLSNATEVTASPQTGRRHQIRVHLYHHGHPVLGDRLYGAVRPVGGAERLMLHALSISFCHPSGETMTFTAPVDSKWIEIVGRLNLPGGGGV